MRRLECTYERKINVEAVTSSKTSDQIIEVDIDGGSGTVWSSSTEPSLRRGYLRAAEAPIEHANTLHGTAPQAPRRIALENPLDQTLGAGLENGLDLDWGFDIDSWIPARSINLEDQTTTTLEDFSSISQYSTNAKDIGTSHFPERQFQIPDSNLMTVDLDSQRQEHENPSPPSMPWYRLPPTGLALVQNPPRLPTSLSVQHTAGIFLPRSFATKASSLTAKYLKAVLSSYPKLMIQNPALPPYVHPYFSNNVGDDFLCSKDKTYLPESLAICSSIVQMSLTKTRESHTFVWRTIRLEQERLFRKVCTLDRYGLGENAEIRIPFLLDR